MFNFSDTNPVCLCMQDGVAVKEGGDRGNNLGVLIRLINPLGSTFIYQKYKDTSSGFPLEYNGYTVQAGNVKWGVGGISLRLDETLEDLEFYNGCETNTENKNNRPRTAIGYKAGRKIILCTFFDPNDLSNTNGGCTVWDVRTVMRDKFSCTMGLNLDGGGSTQIRYKQDNIDKVQEIGSGSSCYMMISAPL